MRENRVLDIRAYRGHSSTINFAGTLRNERKFELFQNVFIKSGECMYQCKVVGIELPPTDNPSYIYKLELPRELIEIREGESWIPDDAKERESRTCESIFGSIKEAKESALRKLNSDYELSKNKIDSFFAKYEKNI